VRELENLCQWITVMAPGQQVEVGDLPAELREPEASTGHRSDGSPATSSAVHVVDWTLGLAEEGPDGCAPVKSASSTT
jgi:two-component system nitrogen regulation response regulator GlnG